MDRGWTERRIRTGTGDRSRIKRCIDSIIVFSHYNRNREICENTRTTGRREYIALDRRFDIVMELRGRRPESEGMVGNGRESTISSCTPQTKGLAEGSALGITEAFAYHCSPELPDGRRRR